MQKGTAMELNRRTFVKTAFAGSAAAFAAGFAGLAGTAQADEAALEPLPVAETDPDAERGTDVNINMATIDQYLGRPDVAYRDVRHLYATNEAGETYVDLASTLEGFKIVPYIKLAPMSADTAKGDELFTLEWDADGAIVSATPNYAESELVLRDLFPQDKPIFLMCTSGGRASMAKALLLFLGWNPDLLYNIGGQQNYEGTRKLEIVSYPVRRGGDDIYAVWRADYANIDPAFLHPVQ